MSAVSALMLGAITVRRHRADIRTYDRIHRQILEMADMLGGGIAAQFPRRFR